MKRIVFIMLGLLAGDLVAQSPSQDTTGRDWRPTEAFDSTLKIGAAPVLEVIEQEWIDQAWVNVRKKEHVFGPDGQSNGHLRYEWQGSAWVAIEGSRWLVMHDSLSIRWSVREEWLRDAWVPEYRWRHVLDMHGLPIEWITQYWEFGEWTNRYKVVWVRQDSVEVSEATQLWDGTEWYDNERNYTFYDSLGRRIERYSMLLVDSVLVNQSRSVWRYDSTGNTIDRTSQEWEGQEWVNTWRSIDTYNERGEYEEYSNLYWINGEWVKNERGFFEYDGQDRLTMREEHRGDYANEWQPSWQSHFRYDGAGQYIGRIGRRWDETMWVNRIRETLARDDRGNIVESIDEDWQNDDWAIRYWSRTWREYDQSGNVLQATRQEWDGLAFHNNHRVIYVYGVDTHLADESVPESNRPTLQSYPNPFESHANLVYELPRDGRVKLTVLDVLGRTVSILEDGELRSGRHVTDWTGAMSAGVYVARLETETGVVSLKLTKAR